MRAWILAVTMTVIASLAPAVASANHYAFVRLVCYGQAPVRATAIIEIDGTPLQVQCTESQRVVEVPVSPRDPAWTLQLEMLTPMGKRTILRQGSEWPLTLSTELDDRECQLDLH